MDMTQCKKGDQLLLRNGKIATLEGIDKKSSYPYQIRHIARDMHILTEEGLVFNSSTSPYDVVGFATKSDYDDKNALIDKVLETIKADVINGDVTAIEELLKQVPNEILKSYLPEE